jgi:alpha-beta hydrolase superfamily lysophospholipase
MKKEYLKINSNSDELPLSVAIFEPEGEAKAIVQFAHGMAEHKERYYPFMEFLAENGYICVINDHRGHGESVLEKNDLGYFYDDTGEFIVEDLHQITMYMKENYQNKPVFLFGHSMGSLVVRKYIKKYDKDISKLIVCGSPSENSMIGMALALVDMQKAFKGDRYRSPLIQSLTLGSYNKNIKKSGATTSGNEWISVCQENVDNYNNDELCGFTFTLNGFRNLFLLMKDVYSPEGWNVQNKDLPILFIAGEDDPVIAGKDAWQKSQEFLKNRGYTNVTGKLYKGVRHEIFNEKVKDVIYKEVLNFIE